MQQDQRGPVTSGPTIPRMVVHLPRTGYLLSGRLCSLSIQGLYFKDFLDFFPHHCRKKSRKYITLDTFPYDLLIKTVRIGNLSYFKGENLNRNLFSFRAYKIRSVLSSTDRGFLYIYIFFCISCLCSQGQFLSFKGFRNLGSCQAERRQFPDGMKTRKLRNISYFAEVGGPLLSSANRSSANRRLRKNLWISGRILWVKLTDQQFADLKKPIGFNFR